MTFVHDDGDFPQLLTLVTQETRIAPALVEKDYWVTHCMWAVQHGSVGGLPPVANWTSANKGPVAARRAFHEALPNAFVIPGVKVDVDQKPQDKHARSINLIGRYPGVLLDQLTATMSPYVFFEIGRARVVPFVERRLTSFVHEFLERRGQLKDYTDNRPRAVRCVHPLVTLLEKLDALARRYAREPIEADGFARHYEDAAHIIRSLGRLPAIEQSPRALADDMLREKDIAAVPSADEPALLLSNGERRAAVERALAQISPMFWGPRVPLDEACTSIRAWIQQNVS